MRPLPTSSPALALFAPVVALATVDAVDAAGYLKIGDIKGESTDDKHKGWIDISSFSWGITCEPDGTGGPGVATPSKLVFTKYIDKSSPILMLRACTGQPIEGDAVIVFNDPERNGGQDYLKITFYKVEVSSYQTGGSSGDPVPVDSVSLNFSKVTFEYTPADGSEPVVETRDFSAPAAGSN